MATVTTQATRRTLSASTLTGDPVRNPQNEDLGKVEELMIDLDDGRVAYCVLSFGGFLGMGNKLFAVPWGAMTLDTANHAFVLDVPKERLKEAPGFDKDHWPDLTDEDVRSEIYGFYNVAPYWE
jgi:sporulation protein YlmC with PRC-barrel domain